MKEGPQNVGCCADDVERMCHGGPGFEKSILIFVDSTVLGRFDHCSEKPLAKIC